MHASFFRNESCRRIHLTRSRGYARICVRGRIMLLQWLWRS